MNNSAPLHVYGPVKAAPLEQCGGLGVIGDMLYQGFLLLYDIIITYFLPFFPSLVSGFLVIV